MQIKTALLIVVIGTSLAVNAYLLLKPMPVPQGPIIVANPPEETLVMRTNGGLLEVSTIKATEFFKTTTTHTVIGVPVGATIAQIRVPAVYRYHIELAPEWRFFKRGQSLVAIAPAIKPSLPVAFDSAKLAAESSGTWSLITGPSTLVALQRVITPVLAERSVSVAYMNLQRESARQTVMEFVKKWVLGQEKWSAQSDLKVQVFFTDEPIKEMQSQGYRPTPLL